jgi:hypothetical protein
MECEAAADHLEGPRCRSLVRSGRDEATAGDFEVSAGAVGAHHAFLHVWKDELSQITPCAKAMQSRSVSNFSGQT